jgi:hypothetical protein
MSAAPLSEWQGVKINISGRVTYPNLSDNSLYGYISDVAAATNNNIMIYREHSK